MLAEAGLLDGEEATCHWATADLIRARYPAVRLRPERVLVPAGAEHRLVTAGASASWTDLALYLVARFCGEDEARRIAKLFLFGDRSDGQLPFAARVRPRQHDDAAVAAAQVWIADNYACANPVAEMTRVSGLRRAPSSAASRPRPAMRRSTTSSRSGSRRRSRCSRRPTRAIDAIAEEVGYAEPAAFRRIFKRATGISPLQYRQRFRSVAAA